MNTIQLKRIKKYIWIMILLLAEVFLMPFHLKATTMEPDNYGAILSDKDGKILFIHNPDTLFIPASILKIMTSLAAFDYLGPEFRFKTEVFWSKDSKLKIKGFGDPVFTSEAVDSFSKAVAKVLKEEAKTDTTALVIDTSFFHSPIQIPGAGSTLNPYDAPVGAFCANFNTIFFKTSQNNRALISAEPQTPLIPFAKKKAIASRMSHGRIIIPEKQTQQYAGLLVRHFLKKQGIIVPEYVEHGTVDSDDKILLTYRSEADLKSVVRQLLEYSNNFIANQVLLVAGAKAFGPPATLEKGVMALKRYLETFLEIEEAIIIEEGSGLSRKNRITPRAMHSALMVFRDHAGLLRHEKHEYFKTGTLDQVSTRAGYLIGKKDQLYPFVIMVNQKHADCNAIKKKLHTIIMSQ